jgi:two-component system chemotaxis response regulator CheB
VEPIRVMVVDDSVVVRKMVSEALSAEPDIQVVGTAVNGRAALTKLEQLTPDLITMDLRMPEVDGLQAVRAIRLRHRSLPIIMLCSHTDGGAAAAFEALSAGADDYVPKPSGVYSAAAAMADLREGLVPRIRALTGRGPRLSGPQRPPVPVAAPVRRMPTEPAVVRRVPRALVIASSTGGPEALSTVLPALPASLPVPVLVVQHMPPLFTRQFAARLDRLSALDVAEAHDGGPLEPGTVRLAPGDRHLTVHGGGGVRRLALDDGPPENFCRPSADRLFRSAASAFGGAVLAVVLTGMGSDGRAGAAQIRAAGGTVLAQDRATSVVWGMPAAVVEAGLADEVVPLDEMAETICRRLAGSRGAVAMHGARGA